MIDLPLPERGVDIKMIFTTKKIFVKHFQAQEFMAFMFYDLFAFSKSPETEPNKKFPCIQVAGRYDSTFP